VQNEYSTPNEWNNNDCRNWNWNSPAQLLVCVVVVVVCVCVLCVCKFLGEDSVRSSVSGLAAVQWRLKTRKPENPDADLS
jgi:hypothetical protein